MSWLQIIGIIFMFEYVGISIIPNPIYDISNSKEYKPFINKKYKVIRVVYISYVKGHGYFFTKYYRGNASEYSGSEELQIGTMFKIVSVKNPLLHGKYFEIEIFPTDRFSDKKINLDGRFTKHINSRVAPHPKYFQEL